MMSDIQTKIKVWRDIDQKECLIAYKLGYEAESILSNPFWLNYPDDSDKQDESNARHFVGGWVQKIRDKNE